MSRKLFLQQDSPKSHISEDDREFNDALMEQNIDAVLYTQTLNSPDVNLLQSFNDIVPRNEEELIQAVSVAYNSYLQHKLNHTWLTLQSCFNQIIIHKGDNDYNIEHISKEKLEHIG